MTTSVCMGIYNGEKYIEAQLQSILRQTKRPNEVIMCDDGSVDGTVALVQRFIRENALQDSWHLYINTENKGYPANFYYACSLCTCDVVFLADQDDIWAEQKLEKMCEVLEAHPEAKAVCCKFGLIDANGRKITTLMAPTRNKGTGEVRQVVIEDVFYKFEWSGMVMAYRNVWFQKISSKKIPHDFYICAKAAEENGFLQIDEELAYHRRHDNNTGGEEHRLGKLLNKGRKLKEIEEYLKILNAFTEEQVMNSERGQKALEEKRISMKARYGALKSGKIGKVLMNAWKHRENVRLATVVCDVMIVRKKQCDIDK